MGYKQTDKNKPSRRRKYIIAAVFILLLIISVMVFSLFQTEPNPDPASEKIIRKVAADQLNAAERLNKDPNELTYEDFAKIKTFELSYRLSSGYYLVVKEISDISLLEKFSNLDELCLQRLKYTEKDIPKWMKILSKIHVYDLSDKFLINLRPLEKLPKLKSLDLSYTSFSNIKTLAALTNLQSLNLSSTRVSDIKSIKSLKNLTYLKLDYTSVSDIEPIKELRNLEILNIQICPNINSQQIEDLQKALPNLKIIR